MLSIEYNPPNIEAEYLRCLNECFKDWGDEKTYDWYFKRKRSYPPTDLIVFKKDNEFAAGSAVSYRQILSSETDEILVGIMTGSWTLPNFRRQGFFAKIIGESTKTAKQKGAELLLAFVTEENSSCRQLSKMGAMMIPSFYIFSTSETEVLLKSSFLSKSEKNEKILSNIYGIRQQNVKESIHFAYDSLQDFTHQYLNRLNPTEIYGDAQGSFGIIEKNKETDALQFFHSEKPKDFLGTLLNQSLQNNRKFFLFTTNSEIAKICDDLELGRKNGFVSVLQINQGKSLSENWNIQNGDRL